VTGYLMDKWNKVDLVALIPCICFIIEASSSDLNGHGLIMSDYRYIQSTV
jgi:hypothetical protein